MQEFQPRSCAYNLPYVFDLQGRLDADGMEYALRRLVQRHAVLRTSVAVDTGRPVQDVWPSAGIAMARTNLKTITSCDRHAAMDDALRRELHASFDLGTAPLARARLFDLGADRHVLSLVIHHLVADGWSAAVCLRDLMALYAECLGPVTAPLAPLRLQYSDYAESQQGIVRRRTFDGKLAYWRQQLANLRRADFLLDGGNARPSTYCAGQVRWTLPAESTHGLRAAAARRRATPFMMLLTAWMDVLRNRSGCEDVVAGAVVANRPQVELEALIGCFINVVPIRVQARRAASVGELVQVVRQAAIDGYAHADVPFMSLVRAVAPRRQGSGRALFDSVVNWLPPSHDVCAGGVRASTRHVAPLDTDLPLTVLVESCGTALDVRFVHRLDLIDTGSARDILSEFQRSLARITGESPTKSHAA